MKCRLFHYKIAQTCFLRPPLSGRLFKTRDRHCRQHAGDCVMQTGWWIHTLSKWIQTQAALPAAGSQPAAVTQQVGEISWGLCVWTLSCKSLIKQKHKRLICKVAPQKTTLATRCDTRRRPNEDTAIIGEAASGFGSKLLLVRLK